MANEDIGHIDVMVRLVGPVRKDRKGKLYVMWEGKGLTTPRLPEFQELILENAVMYGAPEGQKVGGGEPEKQAQPEPNKIDLAAIAQTAAKNIGKKPAEKLPITEKPAANDDGLSDYEREMGYS